jgi:hypothetical protein
VNPHAQTAENANAIEKNPWFALPAWNPTRFEASRIPVATMADEAGPSAAAAAPTSPIRHARPQRFARTAAGSPPSRNPWPNTASARSGQRYSSRRVSNHLWSLLKSAGADRW